MAVPAEITRRSQILVVDDDSALRRIFSLLLGQQYDVRSAGDGLEALDLVDELLPELVISDLRMPRMSGFEFLSIMRRRFPQMPLIAISGEFINSGDPVLGIADAFFAKGEYPPGALLEKIAELLANPPQQRAMQTPPIWVSVGLAGEVIVTCTRCLRSFAVCGNPPEPGAVPHESRCIYCGAILQYCIDKTRLAPSRVPASSAEKGRTYAA
jgi:CheY-like chemotaxis protein